MASLFAGGAKFLRLMTSLPLAFVPSCYGDDVGGGEGCEAINPRDSNLMNGKGGGRRGGGSRG